MIYQGDARKALCRFIVSNQTHFFIPGTFLYICPVSSKGYSLFSMFSQVCRLTGDHLAEFEVYKLEVVQTGQTHAMHAL